MKLLLFNTALSCLLQPGYHLRKARQAAQRSPSPDAGLTLIECVVAIAVIALTGAMIGPPLVMAAATRIQNRRAEQALQLAQGEVDRVRSMVVRGEGDIDFLPAISGKDNLDEQPAPTAKSGKLRSPNSTCNTYEVSNKNHVPTSAQVLMVDVDGDPDCQPEFMVQTFRRRLENETGRTQSRDFQMMVRVYSAEAENYLNAKKLEVDEASLRFTSGQGSYWQKPLAVITTRVNQSDTDVALCGYHGLNSDEDDLDCQ